MRLFIFIVLSTCLFVSCNTTIDDEPELTAEDTAKSAKKTGWLRSYYPNGQMKKTEVHYKDGLCDGAARSFYKDGSINVDGMYRLGKRDGVFKWYYEDTKTLYEEIPFKNDDKNGIKKKYHKNGRLAAEAPFKDNKPGMGLKEYSKEGKPLGFPKIVCKIIDKVQQNKEYIIEFGMSDETKQVEFFTGSLDKEGFLNDKLFPIKTEDGVGRMKYKVSSVNFFTQPVNIIAKVKTQFRNDYITQETFYPGKKK